MRHSILLQLWKHLSFSSGEVQHNDGQKAYTIDFVVEIIFLIWNMQFCSKRRVSPIGSSVG